MWTRSSSLDQPLDVRIARLPHGEGLPTPSQATHGAAGYDLASAEEGEVLPGARRLFATGFRLSVPAGYECQLRPRSGLALKYGITLANSPATIDSDYRGELKVTLINLGEAPFTVTRGMRIAQMVFARVAPVAFAVVDELPGSGRGEGGFGSTGQ